MNRLWLLVEWIEEKNVFPSYSVINIDTFMYPESDIEPGKEIFISVKNTEPRRAKIIRISDIKRQVKEHKDFLERQDQQVKNVLQLCMRTIKEMKTDQYAKTFENGHQMNVNTQHSSMQHVLVANCENSASDNETEVPQKIRQSKMTKYVNQTHQTVRYDPMGVKKGTQSPVPSQRRRSVMSSTPLPEKFITENIKLCFDQGTQTERSWSHPPLSKIEEIEVVLKHLYGRFQSLVMKVNSTSVTNETMALSDIEQNVDGCYVVPDNSQVSPNNVVENLAVDTQENNINMGDVAAEQMLELANQNASVQANPIKMEQPNGKKTNDNTRVRRMSAQTTCYSNEMVPIGNGRAMVPARLLNDIDWTSYTTATRQLLQAIFPRKVLATHSLTGKQSPAHLNKPPKKILDPNLVDDIVITVSTKSGVPTNLVRNSITIKCTDEAKLYRNRQRFQFSRQQEKQQNDENVPPSATQSSDESSHYKD